MTNKKAVIDKLIPEMISLRKQGKSNKQIASELNMSRSAVAKRLVNYGVGNNSHRVPNAKKDEIMDQDGISNYDIMRIRNRIEVGQLIMCEVDVIDKGSYSTQKTVKVFKNMYVIKKLTNGRGVLVSNNPDDELGKLVTYVDIIQLRRRLRE